MYVEELRALEGFMKAIPLTVLIKLLIKIGAREMSPIILGCPLLFYKTRICDKNKIIYLNSMSTAIFNTAKRSSKTRE